MKGSAQYRFGVIALSFILLFGSVGQCTAQNITLEIHGPDAAFFIQQANLSASYTDLFEIQNELQGALPDLYKKGYLAANIDSVWQVGLRAHANIYVGEKYQWAKIYSGNIPPHILRLSGFDEKRIYNQPIAPNMLGKVMEKMIRHYENNGYPFVTTFLDSVQIKGNTVGAQLVLLKGPLIKIDTIILNEDAGI